MTTVIGIGLRAVFYRLILRMEGMAAIENLTDTLLVKQDSDPINFVAQCQIYGGTFQQFNVRKMQERGIEVRWILDPNNIGEAEKWQLPETALPGKRMIEVPGCWEAQGIGGPGDSLTVHATFTNQVNSAMVFPAIIQVPLPFSLSSSSANLSPAKGSRER